MGTYVEMGVTVPFTIHQLSFAWYVFIDEPATCRVGKIYLHDHFTAFSKQMHLFMRRMHVHNAHNAQDKSTCISKTPTISISVSEE